MQHNSDEVPPRLERQVATLTSANNNGEIKILTMPLLLVDEDGLLRDRHGVNFVNKV